MFNNCKINLYRIGTSEKGYVSINMTVNMVPGHSSIPPKETAVGILAKGVARLEQNPLPIMFGRGPERDMLISLSPLVSHVLKAFFSNNFTFIDFFKNRFL